MTDTEVETGTTDLDEEFEQALGVIDEEKGKLTDNEQSLVDAWVAKLKNLDGNEDKRIRQDYVKYLKGQLSRQDKHLSVPYLDPPPDSSLPPLFEYIEKLSRPAKTPKKESRRYFCPVPDKKPPCSVKSIGRIPKPINRGPRRLYQNEFESPEEMAKCIARSKGMLLPEFVADISRHTADRGYELRYAMQVEVASFNEYVERIITQRIKDVGELLDDKQRYELLKLHKDCDRWESELSVCKNRLKEIIPDFDLNAYRRDKNYMKSLFSVNTPDPPTEDKFKVWKEENCHRLLWYVNEIDKLTSENNQVLEQITAIKTKTSELEKREFEKQKRQADYISKKNCKYKELKEKSDKLARDIADMLMSLKN